jgi:hypothetical protein
MVLSTLSVLVAAVAAISFSAHPVTQAAICPFARSYALCCMNLGPFGK